MSSIYHVVLTGGVGSRLWPLSRTTKPKQYLNLFSDNSLFELAVNRNAKFVDAVIVVGNKGNRDLSAEGMQKLGIDTYKDIVEATPRNTAPAIAFAAFAAKPEDILLVTPADHIIAADEKYDEAINEAIGLAQQGNIVAFGVAPSRPETGYGYIEHNGQEVLSFREKPDAATAEEFIQSGNFLWNSGMFCFKAGVFLEELHKYQPEVYARSLDAYKTTSDGCLEMDASMQIPSISVDYAVMEKSDKIKVVKADFDWSDMGSFEAVYDHLLKVGHPVDENGNMVIGSKKFTAFVGVENSILVCSKDANLILSKEASQGVKHIYQQLENNNSVLIN
jgi:mannose-1-phosphate guanylyltransferase